MQRIVGILSMETEILLVCDNEISLGELVVLELNHLGTTFTLPKILDPLERVSKHTSLSVLLHEKSIRSDTKQKFNLAVDCGLLILLE